MKIYLSIIIVIIQQFHIIKNDSVKKISFLNIFENYKQEYGKDELYINWWNGIIDNSIVKLIEISDNYFLSFIEETTIDNQIDLFDIFNDYVISEKLVNDSYYYEPIFSKIKRKDDIIALYILSEINKETNSKFFYFFLNIIYKSSPILYNYEIIEYLKGDELYDLISSDISQLKKSYNDLRRLIFSYDEDFKKEFIGSFLFGDYIWAINIVRNYSIRKQENIYIIPGMENILFGIRKLKSINMNCCISFDLTEHEGLVSITAILDNNKYKKYFSNRYDINNYFMFNNSELFIRYGFSYENNILDSILYDNINLSCSELDLKNVSNELKRRLGDADRFKNITNEIENRKNLIGKILNNKLNTTDEENSIKEYLNNKLNFIIHLEECLGNIEIKLNEVNEDL